MEYELTNTPTALPGITVGQIYAMQNKSRHTVYVETTATQPTDPGDADLLFPAGSVLSVGRFRADAGESIWVWTGDAHPGGSVKFDVAL